MVNIVKNFIKGAVLTSVLYSAVEASSLTDSIKDNGVYVGFQSSWPSYGISAKMDVGDKMAVQGIIGFLGTVNSYSLRGIYKFQREQFYNLYGFGSLGILTWGGVGSYGSESVFGFGAGGGVEYDLRGIDSSFIPIFINLELGITIANFDNYSFGSTGVGLGLHYKF